MLSRLIVCICVVGGLSSSLAWGDPVDIYSVNFNPELLDLPFLMSWKGTEEIGGFPVKNLSHEEQLKVSVALANLFQIPLGDFWFVASILVSNQQLKWGKQRAARTFIGVPHNVQLHIPLYAVATFILHIQQDFLKPENLTLPSLRPQATCQATLSPPVPSEVFLAELVYPEPLKAFLYP